MSRTLLAVRLLLLVAALASVEAGAQADPEFRFGEGPWLPVTPLDVGPDGTVYGYTAPDVLASSDGGLNWTARGRSPGALADLEVSGDGTLWAATATGVHRSADGGATWALEYAGEGRDVALDGADVLAVVGPLALRRRDGAWAALPHPFSSDPSYALKRIAGRSGRVALGAIFSTGYGLSGSVAWRADGETSWQRAGCGCNLTGVAIGVSGTVYFGGTEGYFNLNSTPGGFYRARAGQPSVTISTADTRHVASDAAGAVYYAAGVEVRRHLPEPAVLAAVGPAAGRFVLAGGAALVESAGVSAYGFDPPGYVRAGSGLYRLAGGRTVQVGFVPAAVYALAADGPDGLLVGGLAGTVHRLDGNAWVRTGADLELVRAIVPFGGVGPVALGAASVSGDAGTRYALPGARALSGDVGLGLLEGYGEVAAAVGFGAVAVAAVPRGETYGPREESGLVDFAGQTLVSGTDLRALYRAEGPVGYAGAWGPPEEAATAAEHRIYRTADGGLTWAPDTAGVAAAEVFAFVYDPATGETLAGTDAGVLRRGPDGWWMRDGLAARAVRALALVDGAVLAGTDNGLYRRTDGDWARYGTGLDGRTVYAVHAGGTADARWLAVGTDRGVWATRPLGTVESETAPSGAAASLRAWPNPASGALALDAGPAARGATADVFSPLGRRVASVVLGAEGQADLDTRALAPGVYLVRVVRPDGSWTTARVTVVR